MFYYEEGEKEVNFSEEIARGAKMTKKKRKGGANAIAVRQILPICPKLGHFLTYEVVVSLGLMSSVVIVGGEVFEREGETVEWETKRKTVTVCDRSSYLPGDNPVSCWTGG